MRVETIAVHHTKSDDGRFILVKHRYRLLSESDEEPNTVRTDAYGVADEATAVALVAALKQGVIAEIATIEHELRDRLVGISKELLTADEVKMLWEMGRGCLIKITFPADKLVGSDRKFVAAAGDLTSKDSGGYIVEDIVPLTPRDVKLRARLREVSGDQFFSFIDPKDPT
jgi:hypothetical protein